MDSRTTLFYLSSLQRRTAMVLSWGLACLLIASTNPARAGNATPQVYGQTIGNWGHAWWQWALNFPTADNPILQDGNVDCSVGQSGKVWYLAGTFGGAAERTCSIKKGKALFFPLFNGIFWTPLDPAVPEDCTDEQSCRAGVGALIDTITSWTCTVDGTPCVQSYQIVRAQSDARPFNILDGSILTDLGYAPGVREISIADGYWVMLDPLPPGEHTIHFTATASAFGGFSLDVTYHLTVGP
jgi:hypothetical protein